MFQITLHVPLFLCIIFVGVSHALELRSVQEGQCLTNLPSERVDSTWLDRFLYLSGGSKYHLFRIASTHPRFRQMREFEFYYDACYTRNSTLVDGNRAIVGFGGTTIRSYGAESSRPDQEDDGSFWGLSAVGIDAATLRQRITLTDSRTFAVMISCWQEDNQRGWGVYTMEPELDMATQRLIEDHVQALGFRRENNVFLKYGNCEGLEERENDEDRSWPEMSRPRRPSGSQDGKQWPRGNTQMGNTPNARSGSNAGGSIKRGIPTVRTLKELQRPSIGETPPTSTGKGSLSRGTGWSSV